jgi:hypothetical protein
VYIGKIELVVDPVPMVRVCPLETLAKNAEKSNILETKKFLQNRSELLAVNIPG